MKITDFEEKHVDEAMKIALDNYEEERRNVSALPKIKRMPDLSMFAKNKLGVVAFENDTMVGFLCCYNPREHAFDSCARGIFSPIHAHGAIGEYRDMIYKRMYQAAAEKWISHGITYHAIGLYNHDLMSKAALFTYGFGSRCVDAIRTMEEIKCKPCEGIAFEEIEKNNAFVVRELRRMLSVHMGKSPCFMYSSEENFNAWLADIEQKDRTIFVARDNTKIVAYLEISDSAESFITDMNGMANICGAYCLPEYRGKNIIQNLINYAILILKNEEYSLLGVDFESFNATANEFWLKYFTAYTNSVVRRIDECVLHS